MVWDGSGWFWKWLSRKTALNNHILKSLQKQPHADALQKVILEISQYLQLNICVGVFFLIKFQVLQTQSLFESSTQVFSCEHCKIFTNSVSDVTLPVAAFADLVFLIKNIMWDGFYYKGL